MNQEKRFENAKIIWDGNFVKLVNIPHISKTWIEKNYEIAMRKTASWVSSAAATLLEHTSNKTYILIEQYRLPIDRNELGLIAGISDEDIPTNELIHKEIREEVWRIATASQYLTTVASSAGLTNEEIDLYHSVTDWEYLWQQLWEDEEITIHEVSTQHIDEFLMYASEDLHLRVWSRIDTALRYIRSWRWAKI